MLDDPSIAPLVSVVMGVRNEERLVERAVKSILEQTYSPLEIIVVDDGSEDGTRERLASLSDPRVRLIRQPRRGLAAALNNGLSNATGKFIARMDADDVSYPQRIEQQMAALRAQPRIGYLGSGIRMVTPRGRPIRNVMPPSCPQIIKKAMLKGYNHLYHPTLLFRRPVLEAAGGYREMFQVNEDTDLHLRLSRIAEASNVPSILLDYEVRPGSMQFRPGTDAGPSYSLYALLLYQIDNGYFPELSFVKERNVWELYSAWYALSGLEGRHRAAGLRRTAQVALGDGCFISALWALLRSFAHDRDPLQRRLGSLSKLNRDPIDCLEQFRVYVEQKYKSHVSDTCA